MSVTQIQPTANREINVAAAVDGQRFGRFHWAMMLLCLVVLITDGYDVMVVGFVAPAIGRAFNVARQDLTPVFVLGQVGLAIGAFAAGPLADRFGRRKLIMGCTLFYACCTLLTPFMESISQLATLRVITGIGLGGVMPNAIALVSELSPARNRAKAIMVMFSGFSIGSALGGFVAGAVLDPFGWPAVFVVGGVVPLLLLPLMFFYLPESVKWLALHGHVARTAAMLRRMDGVTRPADAVYVTGEVRTPGLPMSSLFKDGRAWMTVLLWVTFFANLMDLNLLAAWMPTYLNLFGGLEQKSAANVAAFYQIGGTAAVLILGYIIDRAGAPRVLSVGYVLAAIAIATIGLVDTDTTSLTIVLFFTGFFVVGGQTGMNAFAGMIYPTGIRSTGVAWAFGVGRFGAMLGPLAGGWMIGQHWPAEKTFMVAALPILLAAVSVILVGRSKGARQNRAGWEH